MLLTKLLLNKHLILALKSISIWKLVIFAFMHISNTETQGYVVLATITIFVRITKDLKIQGLKKNFFWTKVHNNKIIIKMLISTLRKKNAGTISLIFQTQYSIKYYSMYLNFLILIFCPQLCALTLFMTIKMAHEKPTQKKKKWKKS